MGKDFLLEKIIPYLKGLGQYTSLINKIESSNNKLTSYIFEALFAYTLESNGMQLAYEVNISSNNSTVDFVYTEASNNTICFELLSPEMSDELKRECTLKETDINGYKIHKYEILLEGSHWNAYFRPQAQTIRIQEKLLEKVDKFPSPSDNIFSVIVIDCTNFHFGHFDGEDCSMVIYGRTREPLLQEFWGCEPIKGLLDNTYNRRGAKEFRERVSSVIFIPEKSFELFNKAFIVLNNHRSKIHLETFHQKLTKQSVFSKLKYVPPPSSFML